jgi:hypothetical protein
MQMAVDHRLQHALWELDRRLTGDMSSLSASLDGLTVRLRRLVDEHAAGEAALLTELRQVLDGDEQKALADELAALMVRAPTRPHPHTPHVRMTDALTFAVESWVDRIRDQLDSRIIPTPRPHRVARPVGRWGAYLTGQSFPAPPAAPSPAAPRSIIGRSLPSR